MMEKSLSTRSGKTELQVQSTVNELKDLRVRDLRIRNSQQLRSAKMRTFFRQNQSKLLYPNINRRRFSPDGEGHVRRLILRHQPTIRSLTSDII